jgi:putative transcriptional regulator
MGKIANQIRRRRFEQGEMTQEELAKRVGCTRQTIIALEQGKYVPSIELAFRVAGAFGLPLEQVFQYKNDQNAEMKKK